MLGIGSAVVKGAGGIMGAIGGHNNAVDEARARNQALARQYKQQLRIRDANYKFSQANYANRVASFHEDMKSADRAAARAYGVEQLKQHQRIRKATISNQQLQMALATRGGVGAASGKTGSGLNQDTAAIQAVARGQAMNLQNLLEGGIAADYRKMGIQDQLTSYRRRSYSNVATAPQKPLPLMEPQQYSGPSTAGRNLGILNAGIGMATGIAGAFPPSVGGGGDSGVPTPLHLRNELWILNYGHPRN